MSPIAIVLTTGDIKKPSKFRMSSHYLKSGSEGDIATQRSSVKTSLLAL